MAASKPTKKKKRRSRSLTRVLTVVGIGAGFALGFFLGQSRGESGSASPVTILQRQTVSNSRHSFAVSYMADGVLLDLEEVSAGGLLSGTEAAPGGRTILRWLTTTAARCSPKISGPIRICGSPP